MMRRMSKDEKNQYQLNLAFQEKEATKRKLALCESRMQEAITIGDREAYTIHAHSAKLLRNELNGKTAAYIKMADDLERAKYVCRTKAFYKLTSKFMNEISLHIDPRSLLDVIVKWKTHLVHTTGKLTLGEDIIDVTTAEPEYEPLPVSETMHDTEADSVNEVVYPSEEEEPESAFTVSDFLPSEESLHAYE